MTADTLTLADFLLARIAEDEAGQRIDFGGRCDVPEDRHWTRARVLAECEAKRQIVVDLNDTWTRCSYWTDDVRRLADHVVRLLALPYADHPDFHEEWRA